MKMTLMLLTLESVLKCLNNNNLQANLTRISYIVYL